MSCVGCSMLNKPTENYAQSFIPTFRFPRERFTIRASRFCWDSSQLGFCQRRLQFCQHSNRFGSFRREHFKPGARKSRGVVHLIGWPRNGNTILSPKLTVSTSGFGGSTRCSGGGFSYDPKAPWPIFTSSCRSASTGRTSISIAFASARRTTPCHALAGSAARMLEWDLWKSSKIPEGSPCSRVERQAILRYRTRCTVPRCAEILEPITIFRERYERRSLRLNRRAGVLLVQTEGTSVADLHEVLHKPTAITASMTIGSCNSHFSREMQSATEALRKRAFSQQTRGGPMIPRALQSSRTEKILLEDMRQVAQSLGVSVLTLYRWLPASA